MSLLTIAIVLAFAATVYSLIGGVSSMAAGGEVGRRKSEHWMIMRVACQAAALGLVLLAMVG